MSVTGDPTILIEIDPETEEYRVDFNRVSLEHAYNIFVDMVSRFEDGSLLKDEPEIKVFKGNQEVDIEEEVP